MQRILMLSVACILLFVFSLPVGEAAFSEHDYPWPRDLGGRTVRLNTRWTGYLAYTPLGLTGEHDFYDPDPRLRAWIETVEEWFNCKIEFVEPVIHPGQAPAQIAQMFIAGDINFDYVNIQRHDLLPLHAEGFLRALDDVLTDDYTQAIPERWRFLFRPPLYAHMMFGIPYMFQDMGYTVHEIGLFWNKELFEQEGMPTPYELWDAGEWTIEAIENLAREFTRDTTGDGEIDQYGMSYWDGRTRSQGRWYHDLIVFNEAALTKDREGTMKVAITEEEAINAWEWMVHMERDLGVTTGGYRVRDGTAAMELQWFDSIRYPDRYQDTEYTIGFVPFPQGPDAPYHRIPTGNIFMGVMPVTVESPREVVEVVNALYMFKYPYIEPGTPKEHQLEKWYENHMREWELVVYDQRSVDFLKYMTPRVVHSDHLRAAEGVGFWDAVNRMLDGESISAVMHEIEPAFQAYIDEMYQQ